MAIKFYFNEVTVKIPRRRRLKEFIRHLFECEGTTFRQLSFIFCRDKYLLTINKQFLGHDDFTDIITFTLSDPPEPIEGEIYISAERVRENAALLGVKDTEELHRVIFHGALHLCGYKDKTPADKRKMTVAEDRYLKKYFS